MVINHLARKTLWLVPTRRSPGSKTVHRSPWCRRLSRGKGKRGKEKKNKSVWLLGNPTVLGNDKWKQCCPAICLQQRLSSGKMVLSPPLCLFGAAEHCPFGVVPHLGGQDSESNNHSKQGRDKRLLGERGRAKSEYNYTQWPEYICRIYDSVVYHLNNTDSVIID